MKTSTMGGIIGGLLFVSLLFNFSSSDWQIAVGMCFFIVFTMRLPDILSWKGHPKFKKMTLLLILFNSLFISSIIYLFFKFLYPLFDKFLISSIKVALPLVIAIIFYPFSEDLSYHLCNKKFKKEEL